MLPTLPPAWLNYAGECSRHRISVVDRSNILRCIGVNADVEIEIASCGHGPISSTLPE